MALVGIVVAVSWSSPSLRSSSPCCLWCMYMLSTPQHRKTRVYTSVRCTRNLSAQTWLTSPHCGSKPYRVLITGFLGESLFYATLSECGFLDVHFLLFCLLLSLASLCWCSLACMQVCCPYFLNFVNEQTNLFVCSFDYCAHFVYQHCFFLLYGIVSLWEPLRLSLPVVQPLSSEENYSWTLKRKK